MGCKAIVKEIRKHLASRHVCHSNAVLMDLEDASPLTG